MGLNDDRGGGETDAIFLLVSIFGCDWDGYFCCSEFDGGTCAHKVSDMEV